ncbi:MAG: NAD(P)-dependent oxidoreductase [Chloroflexi bacterium]|nr:NAD(P)-dependent oxidoreductase [Chloroflexota bacterium]
MRVLVTGANGKLGRGVVADLLAHEVDVVATDATGSPGHLSDIGVPLVHADLTDLGQAMDVVNGVDAIVHLANIPAPGMETAAATFTRNTTMNFHVFHAAALLGIQRVVWASSETTLGLPFDRPPRYVPIDEAHYPFPTSTYALSKVVTETLAEQMSAWSGVPFVALRFSNIMALDDYALFPSYQADAQLRRWNLWSYIDLRDAAAACRLALTAPVSGANSYIIANSDTVMERPTADLLGEVFPDVPVQGDVSGNRSLFATDAARRDLGWEPRHSWRDEVPGHAQKA